MAGLEGLLGALGGLGAGGPGALGIWDNPLIGNIAFHPSPAQPSHLGKTEGPVRDGTFTVGDGEKVAFRFYLPPDVSTVKAVVYFFHGNAEVCTAMDDFAEVFHDHNVALLSIDYRGYAWGTGQPSLTKLCPDTEKCFKESESLLAAAGCADAKRIAYGRSIGATCAVHLAATYGKISGLIVDSGLMSVKKLPMVASMGPMVFGGDTQMFEMLKEPFDTFGKLSRVGCPTLVMHGDMDEIVPYQQGVDCHAKVASQQKTLKTWTGAGHNDCLMRYASEWQKAVAELFGQALDYSNPFPIGTLVETHSLSTESMNGQKGEVLGPQGERIRVQFPDPIGEKALKPVNLKILQLPEDKEEKPTPLFQASPSRDATEMKAKDFPVGAMVEAHSCNATEINGVQGKVVGVKAPAPGSGQEDRVKVEFPAPHGEKALKPANLRLI